MNARRIASRIIPRLAPRLGRIGRLLAGLLGRRGYRPERRYMRGGR